MGSTSTAAPTGSRRTDRLRTSGRTLLTTLLSVPAALVAAPFWLVAAATRHLPRWLRLEPPLTPWTDAMQYVPVVGWRTRPDLSGFLEADHPFSFTTDSEGWRDASTGIDDADLLVFGDSFAFGQGVDDEHLYSRQTPEIRTKALGSNGYSMVHAVLWMEQLGERLAGKQVAWLVYLGNDLYDNLRPNYGRYRVPFVAEREQRWEIVTAHVSEQQWEFPEAPPGYQDELARLCTPGQESDRALSAATYLLERAQHACRAAGADLTVITVPRRDQLDPRLLPELRARSPEPDRFNVDLLDEGVREACTTLDIPFVALAQHLSHRDYFKVDIHWTRRGNARVSRVLADVYGQRLAAADRVPDPEEHAGP